MIQCQNNIEALSGQSDSNPKHLPVFETLKLIFRQSLHNNSWNVFNKISLLRNLKVSNSISFNMMFSGNWHSILVRNVSCLSQDRQLEDVRWMQDGRLPRQGGAEGWLAESQISLQNSSVLARKRTEQQTDGWLSSGKAGKVALML